MKKKIFLLTLTMLLTFVTSSFAQFGTRSYELVNTKNTNFSIGMGVLLNTKAGDYNFNQNYVLYDFAVGHYFNDRTGLTVRFQYGDETGDVGSTLHTIGLELNNRITDYYIDNVVDVEFNIGLSYGNYRMDDGYFVSTMNYFSPRISIPIIFNISSDKMFQFVLEPSYQYYIPTETKYYDDNGDKVKADISGIGIVGKLKVNF